MMPEKNVPPPPCGYKWIQDGKDHACILDRHEDFQPHECDCGIRNFTKRPRPPLKLAQWKRGKKVVPKK